MNEKDYSDVKPEDFDPYTGPVFTFVPGPYYLGMWCQPFNHAASFFKLGAQGGDITILILRKPEETTNWHMKYRFRYYFEDTAFGEKDQRSWYSARIGGKTEEEVIRAIDAWLGAVCAVAGEELKPNRFFELKGDSEACFEKLLNSAPGWLHCKTEVREAMKEQ